MAGADVLSGTPYRVLGQLGQGGMAIVLLAQDMRDGRRVVIKMLREDFAAREDLTARLRVEAAALMTIRHENLVAVLDWGVTPAGRGYVVMEHLVGRDLRAEFRARGALAPAMVVTIARQVCRGLEVLHARGIIHRDVKPANVFLCDDSAVKLIDLGVAKITAAAQLAAITARRATRTGEVVGTPWFVSPEMLMGNAVTPAADVYAMGLMMYQLLTGAHPFADCRTIDELWQAHLLTMPALPSTRVRDVPRALEAAVMRALAKEPRDRFASAAELGAELAMERGAPHDIRAAETMTDATLEASTLIAPRRSRALAIGCAIAAAAGVLLHMVNCVSAASVVIDPLATYDVPRAARASLVALARQGLAGGMLRDSVLMGLAVVILIRAGSLAHRDRRPLTRPFFVAALSVIALAFAIDVIADVLRVELASRLGTLPMGTSSLPVAIGISVGAALMQAGVVIMLRSAAREGAG